MRKVLNKLWLSVVVVSFSLGSFAAYTNAQRANHGWLETMFMALFLSFIISLIIGPLAAAAIVIKRQLKETPLERQARVDAQWGFLRPRCCCKCSCSNRQEKATHPTSSDTAGTTRAP